MNDHVNQTGELERLRIALGAAIKDVREKKGLGQEDVADSGNLSRLESGKQFVSLARLLAISKALETPMWMFFARAEGAFKSKLWDILTIYNNGDSADRDAIERVADIARRRQDQNDEIPRTKARHLKRAGRYK